jgi:hypothetical protein
MPATLDKTTVEAQITEAHDVQLYNKAFRAQNAYNLLNQYNWEGTGTMPSPISWAAPTGFNFDFSSSNGEIHYASTAYSSLNPAQKREFFQYLPKFITVCMKAYDDTYNL